MNKLLATITLLIALPVHADIFEEPKATIKWEKKGSYQLCHLTFFKASTVDITAVKRYCNPESYKTNQIVYFELIKNADWKELEKFAQRYCLSMPIYINSRGGTGFCTVYLGV